METTFKLHRVLEYSEFFPNENKLDVTETLKKFSRSDLVRVATKASLYYGNYTLDSQKTFFSAESEKHLDYINRHFEDYFRRNNLPINATITIFTNRTILELWRNIFSIPTKDYLGTIAKEDEEITLFKIILILNEKIFAIKDNVSHSFKLDELLFLNGYLTNDVNSYGFLEIMQPQIYYFINFVQNIPNDGTLIKATATLHKQWGITSWQQYYFTLFCVAEEIDRYKADGQGGLPILNMRRMMKSDKTGLFSTSLIDALSNDEDEFIPYDDIEVESKELNVDYRRFRSKPFVRLKGGNDYVVMNNQLLCERLYNSLYFDYLPLIGGKGSVGFYDFNKSFVEQQLFRKTMYSCLDKNLYMYPSYNSYNKDEENKAPDFYVRYPKGELVVVECKAIKMNGEIRDDGDYERMLHELHEKIVLKTHNLDKTRKKINGNPEPVGVGQLINHIDSIEEDKFSWDKDIPDKVKYYPILVFEDMKLLQPGLLSIVNRWFYEQIDTKEDIDLKEICIMPVMVVSINTLYLYNDYLKRNKFPNVIDQYVNKVCTYEENTGKYSIRADADFDYYLRRMPFKKEDLLSKFSKWIHEGIKSKENGNSI